MDVVLPPELERYVDTLVQKEGYSGSSAVIEEALRQHQVNRPAVSIVMTPELEKLLDEGMEDLDQAVTTEALRKRR